MGRPFELAFTDATGGRRVDVQQDLKGKVVVNFWATWCGPCVAKTAALKALYAKYRGKGVEFIGVSLDQPEDEGGLAKAEGFRA